MAAFIFRVAPQTCATVAKEMLHIQTGASVVLEIHQAQLSFVTTASESVPVALCIAATTNLLGSSLTPVCLTGGATCQSSGFGPTASAATGLSYLDSDIVNTLQGYKYLPTPEMRPLIKPTQRVVLRIDATHATEFTAECWIKFTEKGNG